MKTKLIILSSNDIFFNQPLINKIYSDNRIELKTVYYLKEKNNYIKKLKIFFLLSTKDLIKLFLIYIKSLFKKRNLFKGQYFNNVNSSKLINSINKNNPDLVVCINCPQILKDKTIREVNASIYNFHPGDIPTFRGVFIPFYLLKNKSNNACMTFHKIDKYIDKGKIFNKNYINLSKNETIYTIYEKIFLSEQSTNFVITSIINHSNINLKEDSSIDNYYSYPSLLDILKFRFGII